MTTAYMIPKPINTGTQDAEKPHCTIYTSAEGEPLKWAASFTLPAIGDKIVITMNGIGPAIVKGYFQEGGYLGVMTEATNPPEWLKKQNKQCATRTDRPEWYRAGIGCEFGPEIARKEKPRGFENCKGGYRRTYPSQGSAERAHVRLTDQGYIASVITHPENHPAQRYAVLASNL